MVKKSEVLLPYSKLKMNIAELLVREGWLQNVEKIEALTGKLIKKGFTAGRFASIKITLRYSADGRSPKITKLEKISKPGRRVYVSKENIPYVLSGKGLAVISTSRGLLSDREARREKIGGEILCQIY